LLTAAEAAWAHALGVVSLFGFVTFGFPAALPPHVVPQENDAKRTDGDGHSEGGWADDPRQRSWLFPETRRSR
jgi:hypothetical protein